MTGSGGPPNFSGDRWNSSEKAANLAGGPAMTASARPNPRRAALDGRELAPAGQQTPISRVHIRYLLRELPLDAADLDVLALQLTAALDAPLLLYLSGADDPPEVAERPGRGWEDLVRRVCRPGRNA